MTKSPNFDDVWKMFEETDRQSKENDRKFEELRREMHAENERTSRLVSEVSRQLGAQGNRLGEFVQEMVRPAAVRLFVEKGLPVHQVLPNMLAYDDNGQFVMEIDLTVVNAKNIIAIECKSHLSVDDVREHLERLPEFKNCFPQYRDYTLYGAVAGMVIPTEVGRYAYKRGLYVLAQSGESMKILNNQGFRPKEW